VRVCCGSAPPGTGNARSLECRHWWWRVSGVGIRGRGCEGATEADRGISLSLGARGAGAVPLDQQSSCLAARALRLGAQRCRRGCHAPRRRGKRLPVLCLNRGQQPPERRTGSAPCRTKRRGRFSVQRRANKAAVTPYRMRSSELRIPQKLGWVPARRCINNAARRSPSETCVDVE